MIWPFFFNVRSWILLVSITFECKWNRFIIYSLYCSHVFFFIFISLASILFSVWMEQIKICFHFIFNNKDIFIAFFSLFGRWIVELAGTQSWTNSNKCDKFNQSVYRDVKFIHAVVEKIYDFWFHWGNNNKTKLFHCSFVLFENTRNSHSRFLMKC